LGGDEPAEHVHGTPRTRKHTCARTDRTLTRSLTSPTQDVKLMELEERAKKGGSFDLKRSKTQVVQKRREGSARRSGTPGTPGRGGAGRGGAGRGGAAVVRRSRSGTPDSKKAGAGAGAKFGKLSNDTLPDEVHERKSRDSKGSTASIASSGTVKRRARPGAGAGGTASWREKGAANAAAKAAKPGRGYGDTVAKNARVVKRPGGSDPRSRRRGAADE